MYALYNCPTPAFGPWDINKQHLSCFMCHVYLKTLELYEIFILETSFKISSNHNSGHRLFDIGNTLVILNRPKWEYSGLGLSQSCHMSAIYFYLLQLLVIPTSKNI